MDEYARSIIQTELISEYQNAYMKKYSIEESWDDDYDGWWDNE